MPSPFYSSTLKWATSYAIAVRDRSLLFPWNARPPGYAINWSVAEQVTYALLKPVRQYPSQFATELGYQFPLCRLCFLCKNFNVGTGLHLHCRACLGLFNRMSEYESFSYFQEYQKALEFRSRKWKPMPQEMLQETQSSLDWMRSFTVPIVPVVSPQTEAPVLTAHQRLLNKLQQLKG